MPFSYRALQALRSICVHLCVSVAHFIFSKVNAVQVKGFNMSITPRLKELLLQSLVHERGGVLIYQTALECALDDDLREEWEKYLEQTHNHVKVLTTACEALGLDPGEMTPGCMIVQHTGKSLVVAMKMALAAGDPDAAQLVACECVVLAETKDHADWELIGECAKAMDDEAGAALKTAYEAVED